VEKLEQEEAKQKTEEVVENAARRERRYRARRGVVLTRTGAFLIIICLSLGISREERGRPRGQRRQRRCGRVGTVEEARQEGGKKRDPPREERKKERGEVPRKSRRRRVEESEKERQRLVGGSERSREGGTGGARGGGRERFLLRPASKMALAAAPLVIKINN